MHPNEATDQVIGGLIWVVFGLIATLVIIPVLEGIMGGDLSFAIKMLCWLFPILGVVRVVSGVYYWRKNKYG